MTDVTTSTTNGAGQPVLHLLNAELEAACDGTNAARAEAGAAPLPDPETSAVNASGFIQACLKAADHVRQIANDQLALANMMVVKGEAIACGWEKKAHEYAESIERLNKLGQARAAIFEEESKKLAEFDVSHRAS